MSGMRVTLGFALLSALLNPSAFAARQKSCAGALGTILKRESAKHVQFKTEGELVAAFLLTEDVARSPELSRVWKQWKDSPRKKPLTVDLDDAQCAKPSTSLKADLERLSGLEHAPAIYEERVLSLRKGDTVRFGTRSFVLGEYLGAGNATHIFVLAAHPDRVVRIPIMADPKIREWGPVTMAPDYQEKYVPRSPDRRLQFARDKAMQFQTHIEEYLNAVHVYERDSLGRFSVVERLKPETDGLAFVEKFSRAFSSRAVPPEDWPKLYALFDLMVRNGDMQCSSEVCFLGTTNNERQYVFDLHTRTWRVADAEPGGVVYRPWRPDVEEENLQPQFPRQLLERKARSGLPVLLESFLRRRDEDGRESPVLKDPN